jgi:ectoine hydroxylase-related dioxygenase (phytanoyl-CoA dioxygenase family)
MNLKTTIDLQGWAGPLPVLTSEEVVKYRDAMLEADSKLDLMHSDYRCKSNVLFPWIDEISRHPKLVEYLTEVIGPNFHCWDTLLWIKKPGDGRDVSFHQDATYWNFNDKNKAVTVWIALDDVTPEHGSIEYVQGSHRVFQTRHKDVKTESNLLMRGQTVDVDLPKERIKTAVPAGHILMHSPYTIHGSAKNTTNKTRLAMGLIFVSTECRPKLEISPESTVMISGQDKFNYMMHDPRPTGTWEIDVVNWQAAYDRQHLNYYKVEQDAV